MVNKSELLDLLRLRNLSRVDKLLLCIAIDDGRPKQVREIRSIAYEVGLREAKKWNISSVLGRASRVSTPFVVNTAEGWQLTSRGRQRVRQIIIENKPPGSTPKDVVASLHDAIRKITHTETKELVYESVRCYECSHFRAAVVLSWSGAVAILYDHVLSDSGRLVTFNAEARRRNGRWRDARTKDDLSRMREGEFLDVLEAISVIGKNTKQQLQECLRLRNACAHPSTLQISKYKVAAHLETLILNVYSKYT